MFAVQGPDREAVALERTKKISNILLAACEDGRVLQIGLSADGITQCARFS